MKTFGVIDYTNLVPLKCCGHTNGRSGPTTRPAFAKATQVKYSSYNSESTNSTKQKVRVGSQNSKTCHKQPLKKDKTKILITNCSLMKVKSIAECPTWSILQYF